MYITPIAFRKKSSESVSLWWIEKLLFLYKFVFYIKLSISRFFFIFEIDFSKKKQVSHVSIFSFHLITVQIIDFFLLKLINRFLIFSLQKVNQQKQSMKSENKRKSDGAFDFHAGANWSKIKDRSTWNWFFRDFYFQWFNDCNNDLN